MKEIILKSLVIQDFKGIRNLEVDFEGKSVNIYGTNETGKTTIIDAFTWCLFGKDSLGQSNFAIKPRDENGNERLGLEPMVEVVLDVDGVERKFKKIWAEVYKKSRGSADAEYSGNESKCYVDDVPVSLTQYNNEIGNIITEQLFKLITNINTFINLHWKEQREIIFQLVPDVSDISIIADNPRFAKLGEMLNGRKAEDLKEIYKDRNKKINKDLETLPARIAELNRTEYPLVKKEVTLEDIERNLQESYNKLSKAEKDKAESSDLEEIQKHQDTIRGFYDDLADLELKRSAIITQAREEYQKKINELANKLAKVRAERDSLNIDNATVLKRIEAGQKEIEAEEAQRKQLLEQYRKEKNREFVAENCVYCGQPLPQHMVEDLEKKFNLEKAKKLEEIIAKGTEAKSNVEKYTATVEDLKNKKAANGAKLAELDEQIEKLKIAYENAKASAPEINTKEIDDGIARIQERIKVIENVIARLRTKSETSIYDQTIKELKSQIAYLSDAKAQYQLKAQNDARIAELQVQEKQLRKEYEDNLEIITLCEEFSSMKATYLQNKINANFEIVKFELFKKYLNSSIEDTCVATVRTADSNYVPYASANNANKINAGLDIIRTLQKINDVKAPIFIDNAESTVRFLNVDSQLIRLYVSENDKTLRIEKGE